MAGWQLPTPHSRAFGLMGVVIFYGLLVSGGVIPIPYDDLAKALAKGFMLLSMAAFFAFYNNRIIVPRSLIVFLSAGLIFSMPSLYLTESPGYALSKLDGALLATSGLSLIWVNLVRAFGTRYVERLFLGITLLVLLLTIGFKIKFGFFDRGVRFLLNGPIVFGWILSVAAIFAFDHWAESKKFRYLAMLIVFLAGVVWTESKGPLLSLCGALSLYLASLLRSKPRVLLRVLLTLGVVALVLGPFLVDFIADTRLSAVSRLFTGAGNEADEGSIGERIALYNYAIGVFGQHPIFGIGLGNFMFDGFFYPHNQHLEIFLELGLVAGLSNLMFVAISLVRAKGVYRSVVILLFLCAAFSGDISYLRFLYAFCIIGLCVSRGGSPRPLLSSGRPEGQLLLG